MSPKEKYYKYVVDMLMKEIDIDQTGNFHRISFPWVMEDMHNFYNDSDTSFPFYRHTIIEIRPYDDSVEDYPTDMEFFGNYVVSKYGVRRKEVDVVWMHLKQRLYDMADAE